MRLIEKISRKPAPEFISSVPNIGQGNPAQHEAIDTLSRELGVDIDAHVLNLSTPVQKTFHILMTQFDWLRKRYNSDPEKLRQGFASKLMAQLNFLELDTRVRVRRGFIHTDIPKIWIVVQEHPLLGASPELLASLNIQSIKMVIPDVFPKESAILAATQFNAEMYVWNQEAYNYLLMRGMAAHLIEPFLWLGLQGDVEKRKGKRVVIKSSGSGIPRGWRKYLTAYFEQMPEANAVDWSMHLPGLRLENGVNGTARISKDKSNWRERLRYFAQSIGTSTRYIIGYPSELVGLIAELQAIYHIPVQLLSLPPRGEHEYKNLDWAQEAGILAGVISFEDVPESVGNLAIAPEDIGTILQATPKLSPTIKQYVGTESPGILFDY